MTTDHLPGPAFGPRPFRLVRDVDHTGISGTGLVAEGVEYTDGTVVLRWRGEHSSTVVWESLADALAVHGHGGATRVEWVTPLPVVTPPVRATAERIVRDALDAHAAGLLHRLRDQAWTVVDALIAAGALAEGPTRPVDDEVEVEGSFFRRTDLPDALARHIRARDAAQRETKEFAEALHAARRERDDRDGLLSDLRVRVVAAEQALGVTIAPTVDDADPVVPDLSGWRICGDPYAGVALTHACPRGPVTVAGDIDDDGRTVADLMAAITAHTCGEAR